MPKKVKSDNSDAGSKKGQPDDGLANEEEAEELEEGSKDGQPDESEEEEIDLFEQLMAKKNFKNKDAMAEGYEETEAFARQQYAINQELEARLNALEGDPDEEEEELDFDEEWENDPSGALEGIVDRALGKRLDPVVQELQQTKVANAVEEMKGRYGQPFNHFLQDPASREIIQKANGNVEAAFVWWAGQSFVDTLGTGKTRKRTTSGDEDERNAQMLSSNPGKKISTKKSQKRDIGDAILDYARRKKDTTDD